jgi:hypothetical protein
VKIKGTRYPVVLPLRLGIDEAERLKRYCEADDRRPGTVARRWIVEGLRRAEQATNQPKDPAIAG